MFEKIAEHVARYAEVEKLLADPETMKDMQAYTELAQEHAHLRELVEASERHKEARAQLASSREMAAEDDEEMAELAALEVEELEAEIEALEARMRLLLVPKDPLDGKNIIMEIRAGTGGEEAALFVADLYRMYSYFANNNKWKTEILSINETGIGGIKEVVFSIAGKEVYGNLRYESGVHRVQRVPSTESGGRIHTSAVTVAVLPEAEDTDIQINQEDLKIDVYRSSGPGGQSVNTTDSAVRITHLPTGLVVTCQDEKSQIKNKAKALRVLRSRLYEIEEEKKQKERAEARKSQVGSGDRSERIRTYNYPQSRVTDHRIGLTLYKLDAIMMGDISEIVDGLKIAMGEALLQEA